MQIHCSNSLSHLECDGHPVHMLIQWRLPSPLTSTVKPSLLIHAHSRPLSLAARLHQCHTNHSHYINNSQNFPDRPCTISMSFDKCVGLCNYHHPDNPLVLIFHQSPPPISKPEKPLICYYNFPFSKISYTQNHTIFFI